MDILLIVVLILLNGLFAMSEMALSSSRKVRLLALQEAGEHGADSALQMMERPTQFLSTIQIGITSIGVLNGIVGEAAFSDTVAGWLQQWGASSGAATIAATAVVVTLITFLTIIFGELVPKRIGQLYPETIARRTAPMMRTLGVMARPFIALLSASTSAVLRLMRMDTRRHASVTEEEISASLSEGVHAGLIEHQEHQMVKNVFHLDDRPLTSLMVPRSDIDWLEARATVVQAREQLTQMPAHSWYPVCRGGLDDVVGMVSLAELTQRADPQRLLEDVMVPVAFAPETLSGLDLLEQFRRPASRTQRDIAEVESPRGRLVMVVDEYGVVQGLMTPRDLLEAITGEWVDSAKTEEGWATLRSDGSWLLDGTMPVVELKSRLGLTEALPGEERGLYNTLAGLIMSVTGRVPQTGEIVHLQGWEFEVVDLDGRRIDKVLARTLSSDEPTSTAQGRTITKS
jgi:putative hemolysin